MNKYIELKVTETEQCFCKKFKSRDGKSKPSSPHLFTALKIYMYIYTHIYIYLYIYIYLHHSKEIGSRGTEIRIKKLTPK